MRLFLLRKNLIIPFLCAFMYNYRTALFIEQVKGLEVKSPERILCPNKQINISEFCLNFNKKTVIHP